MSKKSINAQIQEDYEAVLNEQEKAKPDTDAQMRSRVSDSYLDVVEKMTNQEKMQRAVYVIPDLVAEIRLLQAENAELRKQGDG